jgi:hypothetical protein
VELRQAQLSRTSVLAALVWVLLASSWTFLLVIVASAWDALSALAILAAIALSAACCIALWKLLHNRQSFLLGVSLAGMASFLGSYLIMFLLMGISM